MISMQLTQLDAYLRKLLQIDEMKAVDSSANGLQVDRDNQEIRRVATAVDACLETFQRATEWGADLLFVHHGLFWGYQRLLTGAHRRNLAWLLQHDLALYAVHLPLDRDPEYGNNIGIARLLNLIDIEPFGRYRDKFDIGYRGRLRPALPFVDIVDWLHQEGCDHLQDLPFGPERVETVGIISGGAPKMVQEAIDTGLDLYITGDAAHSIYHQTQEAGINVLFAGHYYTETWGVRAIAKHINQQLGIETRFLDVPTGL